MEIKFKATQSLALKKSQFLFQTLIIVQICSIEVSELKHGNMIHNYTLECIILHRGATPQLVKKSFEFLETV